MPRCNVLVLQLPWGGYPSLSAQVQWGYQEQPAAGPKVNILIDIGSHWIENKPDKTEVDSGSAYSFPLKTAALHRFWLTRRKQQGWRLAQPGVTAETRSPRWKPKLAHSTNVSHPSFLILNPLSPRIAQ